MMSSVVTKKSLGGDDTCTSTANASSTTLKCSPITTKQKKRSSSQSSIPQKCSAGESLSVEGDDYPETAQNLLLDDTYSEDELGRWMEEQQQLSQTQKLNDDSSVMSRQLSSTSKPRSKRPASGPSESDLHTTTSSSKRRKESSSHLPVPNNDDKSEARKRMDKALHDRYQCQMALRDSLVALREAQALVRACRKKYNAAKCNAQTVAKNECETLLKEENTWNEFFQKLKAYKERTGHCNVKQNFASKDSKNCPETAKLSAWVGRNRKDGKQRRRAGSVEDGSSGTISDDQDDNASVFDEVEPDSIHADPYKLIALDQIGFDWDPRNSRWMSSYEELKAFKLLNGNTLVPHANCGLGSWVKRQQVQYTLYTKGDGSKSELSSERVRLLNDLCFVWSRRSNTWNESFQRLSKWKEDHGNCNIPDDSDDPELVALNKWIADQRMHYKRQSCEDEETGTDDATTSTKAAESSSNNGGGSSKQKGKRKVPRLTAEKIAQLTSIGFEFDSRDAKWMQRLDELYKYKEEHGDFLVPSTYPDNPTLSNWVASQRAQYKLYKKGGKTNLTERRLKILIDAGFSFSGVVNDNRQKETKETSHQDRVAFDAKPWLEKYKDLLFFIASNDGIESLQNDDPYLAEWNVKEHDDSRVEGTALTENNSAEGEDEMKERASLMEASDFFAFCQGTKEKIILLRDSADVESTYKEGLWDQQPNDTKMMNTNNDNLC